MALGHLEVQATGRMARSKIRESTARQLIGTRVTSGLAAGLEYGMSETGDAAAAFRGKRVSARQELAMMRGGVRGVAAKVGTRVFGSATKSCSKHC